MRFIPVAILLFLSAVFTAQTVDEMGRKQGYWIKKDEKTNKLIYEGEFKDDKPVGTFKYYYPNDSVRALMKFRPDGRTAYAKLFHMNGNRMAEGKYLNKEMRDSVWTFYDEAGQLISRDRYVNGKKNGLCMVYLPDGTLAEEKTYKDDQLNGPYKEFFGGGSVRSAGTYSNGQLEGRTVYYYPNGTEVAAGYHRQGKKNGPWIYKTETGKIREKELYKNGTLASEKETREFFSRQPVNDKKEPAANKGARSKQPAKK